MADKTVTARVPEELHKKLRIKLAEDDRSYQSVAIKLIKKYVEGEIKLDK